MSLQIDINAAPLHQSRAIIYGCRGLSLEADERAFYHTTKPLGFILFARNIDTPEQVKALVQELRGTVGWNCPILIDQEGGKVERLKPPHWRSHAPAETFAKLFQENPEKGLKAVTLNTLSISHMLWSLGITVNCAPVLDLPVEGAHDIIGNRAYGHDLEMIIALGRAVADTHIASAVTPVIKHIPGHGRAMSDSHEDLPKVDTDLDTLNKTDFETFRRLCTRSPLDGSARSNGYWGMTAHVLYTAIDKDKPATLSKEIIQQTIRKDIGFDGFLVGDDVFMKALAPYGDLRQRVAESIDVGIDAALFCHGTLGEIEMGAMGASLLRQDSINRLIRAETLRSKHDEKMKTMNIEKIRADLDALLPSKNVA